MEWISIEKRFPEHEKVLAIYVSKPGVLYNMRHDGWFPDTIYTCRIHEGKFVIESHGPYLPATHWMQLPERTIKTESGWIRDRSTNRPLESCFSKEGDEMKTESYGELYSKMFDIKIEFIKRDLQFLLPLVCLGFILFFLGYIFYLSFK